MIQAPRPTSADAVGRYPLNPGPAEIIVAAGTRTLGHPLGNVARAPSGFDRALLLDPLDEAIKRNLAIYQMSSGRLEAATAYFGVQAQRQYAQDGLEVFAVSAMIASGDADRADAFDAGLAKSPAANH